MVVRPRGNSWEVHAPAKLNLHLEILARRTDGFHEIETLMLSVSLYDTLQVRSRHDGRIEFHCRWSPGLLARFGDSLGDLPGDDANIVLRAVKLLRKEAGVALGSTITLHKRIPSQAGLGGASSDAAAALVAANEAWELGWPRERLAELAGRLGSDIPFFLFDGAAICRGRGERIEPLDRTPPLWVVIVRPPQGLSTPAVYKACRVPSSPAAIGPLVESLRRGDAAEVAKRMMNRLQTPAEELLPGVVQLRDLFARTDCLGHQMSGSGSSYFGICRSARHARRIACQLAASQLGLVAWGAAA
jgi:4-diphosphocytidyl-2-C-methyl-D-erythritol kinase